jgi:hypothetical protein
VAGFPTVILILLVMGTFILLGLGVIGEYLARIHDEVRNRPRYLIQDAIGDAGRSTPSSGAAARPRVVRRAAHDRRRAVRGRPAIGATKE